MEYKQGLIIDGTTYDIPLVKIDRTFDFYVKYANRSEDGDVKIETIGGYQNYTVEIDPGTLTVLPSFNPADDYWFGTAPWDKERNLRERKAEFHYVAGGMSL